MKKSTLFKSVLTVVSVFTISGAMAQDPAAILTDYTKADEVIYQTAGLGLKLYALPDLVYSPSYKPASNKDYNTMSQWRWVIGADWATGTELKAWANENYVEIPAAKLAAAGSQIVVRVKERFNIASMCEPTTDQTKTITTVAVPEITAIAAVGTGWSGTAPNFTYCGENIGDVINVTISENGVLAAMQKYMYDVTVKKVAGDMNGTFGTLVKDDAMSATASVTTMAAGTSITVPTLTMIETAGVKYPTKYSFEIAANTFFSYTSRVSCTRAGVANVTTYTVPTTVITYTLYPTPTTGPIYHIINNYSF